MRPETAKNPRKIGRHISLAIDFLHENGAKDIQVYKTRHVEICFTLGQHSLSVRTACTPRDEGNCFAYFKTDLRHALERLTGAR